MALTVSPGIQNTDYRFMACNTSPGFSKTWAVPTSSAFPISEEIAVVLHKGILFCNFLDGIFIETIPLKSEKDLHLDSPPDLVLMKAIKILGISISDIALILEVSRPTVYSYKNKLSSPEGIVKEKLQLLDAALCQIEVKCPNIPFESMLKRKDKEGISLFALLQGNKPVEAYVARLCEIALKEEITRQTLRQQYGTKRNVSLEKEGSSLPGVME